MSHRNYEDFTEEEAALVIGEGNSRRMLRKIITAPSLSLATKEEAASRLFELMAENSRTKKIKTLAAIVEFVPSYALQAGTELLPKAEKRFLLTLIAQRVPLLAREAINKRNSIPHRNPWKSRAEAGDFVGAVYHWAECHCSPPPTYDFKVMDGCINGSTVQGRATLISRRGILFSAEIFGDSEKEVRVLLARDLYRQIKEVYYPLP